MVILSAGQSTLERKHISKLWQMTHISLHSERKTILKFYRYILQIFTISLYFAVFCAVFFSIFYMQAIQTLGNELIQFLCE